MIQVYFVITIIVSCLLVPYDACELYLATSTLVGAGRGIFAGRDFAEGEYILDAASLVSHRSYSSSGQLGNYVFGSLDDDYQLISLNYMCSLNHSDEPNIAYYWASEFTSPPSLQDYEIQANYTPVHVITTRNISVGEELFISYGDTWFEERFPLAISEVKPVSVLPNQCFDDISLSRHCISNIFQQVSNKHLGGTAVFANRTYARGAIVSISPVLAISLAQSLLLNYCIIHPGSRVAFLPLGHLAMINHATGKNANVEMSWFEWAPGDLDAAFKMSLDELLTAKMATLDVQVVATRDIVVGEEITMDYGQAWLDDWVNYLARRVEWMLSPAAADASQMPLFRHPIMAPPGMELPPQWY